MKLPENDYQILRLTDSFYNAYPAPPYIELLQKRQRAYNCLLFQTHYDYFICIPFQSKISHEYSFRFKKSKRSQKHKSGLDYTKIIIIGKTEYLDTKDAVIDRDEFIEMRKNLNKIKKEALEYVEEYIAHASGTKVLREEKFKRKYGFSARKYFHKELGIP